MKKGLIIMAILALSACAKQGDGRWSEEKAKAWAEDLGFNTVRVFLSCLVYFDDPEGYIKHFDEPEIWFHDIFHLDGTPYSEEEVAFIKKLIRE